MYSFGDVNRLPEYGRDELAWSSYRSEVIQRSQFASCGGCVASAARTVRRWLGGKIEG